MHVYRSHECGVDLKGKRILVVEDEALVSILMEDELLGAGADVVGPASSIGDALALVEQAGTARGWIDAAVLDINMNGKHVAPVADRLAALGVPFLFATGYGGEVDTCGHAAAPRVEKPFAATGLVAAVEALSSARTRPAPRVAE